jgi:hypothetical protein
VTGVITLLIFWVSAMVKMVSNIEIDQKGLTGLTSAISIMAIQLVWASLFYFTFEMKMIQNVLQT